MQQDTHPSRSLQDLCREVIADLAAQQEPTATAILRATNRHIGPRASLRAQVRAQVVAGVAAAYFRLYRPDPPWAFQGRDSSLGTGRTDLVWIDPSGRVMVDVVLADARPSRSSMTATARSVRAEAAHRYGPDLLCLRLLVPRTPQLS